MNSLIERLNALHIKPVSTYNYKRAYKKLQRKHETWLRYLIECYSEQFNVAITLSAICAVLLCIVGGVGYFLGFTTFGNLSVGFGLISMSVCVVLMMVGVWSNTQVFNTPTPGAEWSKEEIEQLFRLPSTVHSIIGIIEGNPEENISYSFSFEAFCNPETETETVLLTLWADDTAPVHKNWSERVCFWIDNPHSADTTE